MKIFHSAHISAFVKEDEDLVAIKKALVALFPLAIEEQKITLQEEITTGITGNKITTLKLSLTKEKHTKILWKHLLRTLTTEQKKELIQQENRIDENCQFFIRLDKKELLKGKYELTDGGNCIHLRFCVATFPKKREVAVQTIQQEISKHL